MIVVKFWHTVQLMVIQHTKLDKKNMDKETDHFCRITDLKHTLAETEITHKQLVILLQNFWQLFL